MTAGHNAEAPRSAQAASSRMELLRPTGAVGVAILANGGCVVASCRQCEQRIWFLKGVRGRWSRWLRRKVSQRLIMSGLAGLRGR